jgi:hypothetical protein
MNNPDSVVTEDLHQWRANCDYIVSRVEKKLSFVDLFVILPYSHCHCKLVDREAFLGSGYPFKNLSAKSYLVLIESLLEPFYDHVVHVFKTLGALSNLTFSALREVAVCSSSSRKRALDC